MRTSLLFTLLLFFVSAVMAQENGWITFAPEECGFSIEMPSEPTLNAQTSKQLGQTLNSYVYTAQAGALSYVVNCSDYPAAKMLDTKQKALNMLKDSAKRRVGKEPSGLKEIEVEGHVGIEYVQELGQASIYARAIIVDEKIYLIDVGDILGGNQEKADRFFASFSLNK